MAKGVRRQGRELALKILYSLPDHEGGTLEDVLADFWRNFHGKSDFPLEVEGLPEQEPSPPSRRFAEELVAGVADQLERVDRMIEAHSSNWSLDRMARVDLALLRMATFELLCSPDVPASVVINEAIEIGKCFGTKETPAFINGILDQVARHARL